MEFYVESRGDIAPADMEEFRKIRLVVGALPDIIFDPNERWWDGCRNQFTCHLICRAMAAHFKVVSHDGYFTHGYQHSWLIPESGTSIIDAYPVAGAAPFIVARNRSSPWVNLYKPSKDLDSRFKTNEFQHRLERTVHAAGETANRLGVL